MQFDSASSGSQLEAYVEQLRAKLPAAPEGLIDFYVRWWPWVYIVTGAFGVLAFLALSALTTIALPFLALGGVAGLHAGGAALIFSVLGVVASAADLVGGVLMLQRRLTGWWIVAAGIVVGLLSNLLTASLFGLVITLLFAYIHVEARPQYN